MDERILWKKRFERMKSHYGWTNQRISDITGITKGTIDSVTTDTSREFHRWIKLAIVVFEIENGLKEEAINI